MSIFSQAVIRTRQEEIFMPATNQREIAEAMFERNQRREANLNEALRHWRELVCSITPSSIC